jgi:peptide/nickel transport system permease protein
MKWLLNRLLLLILVLWGITTIVFVIMSVVPRNPAIAMAGTSATPEQLQQFNERWGMTKPVIQRYFDFYAYLLRGDLGTSIRTGRPIITEVRTFFPATFELATCAMLISLIAGIFLGSMSAIRRNKFLDQVSRFFSLVGVSTPSFWMGLLILLVFYYFLGGAGPGRVTSSQYVPRALTGFYLLDSLMTLNFSSFWDCLRHIAGPAFSLGFYGIGVVTRMMRSSMLDVLNMDYIKAARSRGLSMRRAILKHAIKNSLIPTVTAIGVLYGTYLGGVMIIEAIFSWPGLGSFVLASILKADFPAILGTVLVVAFLRSLINLAVDIIYRFLDPRITFKTA